MDPLSFTAEQILAVDIKNPEKLFSITGFKTEFLRLRKKWHSDFNPNPIAGKVFHHINELADVAETRIKTDTWNGPSSISFTSHDGRTFRFNYRVIHDFELGKMYIGTKVLMFVIDKPYEDLFDNGVKMLRSIKYPSTKMETEFSRLFPKIKFIDKNTSRGMVVVFDKPSNAVLLQDVINYMPSYRIDPKHVAWITSSLYNIAVFLDHVGICHNSITPTTVFIDPENHAASRPDVSILCPPPVLSGGQ